ncbi:MULTISPECIES: S8 family serine peptidase [unclassified Solwaraspora]|uniref:S8 family serine peptidase n=1 Tax=unclassified Solwaraspora TaxID=2627926 RepID=UPI00248C113A|nr:MULTISPECIES: S8 family serine peptidase [unclassified Solwaraspora]WBB98438.1 S8 family serine peptidase [Solwaraspora sp. WMMA2059]WBC23009.1 S8 family serine peptidase [Solwaraspora sp. WMMA2080]WJK34957.1 S8 family serine peptidase [Solwaraspora sp. WMMA2065]
MSAVHQRRGYRKQIAALSTVVVLAAAVAGGSATRPDDVPATRPGTAPAGDFASLWNGSPGIGQGTSLADVRSIVGADTPATAALDGTGIGIAMIDTGVVPVPGLPANRLVNGPDLSFESQATNLRWLDTYGHGTHLAGVLIGDDPTSGARGLAPKAKLTSVKVGTANGAVDVSQVIAAVDWVVTNRDHDPTHPIRVLNLAYGSAGNPAFWTDPLHFAVEQAWHAGIVVVAAAGNDGNGFGRLDNPATNPYVVTVGASLTKGTLTTADDELAPFTNLATAGRQLDLLAPGESVLSLRNPGSNVDNHYPGARVGSTLFRGTGTSQAVAVTSAVAALLLQAKPWLTPDEVKQVLVESGTFLPTGGGANLGLRSINLQTALTYTPVWQPQQWTRSDGHGPIDASRGTSRVARNNVTLQGEQSIFGPFSSPAWASQSAARTAWSGGVWLGHRMAADGWTGTSWASRTWGGAAWTSPSWDGSGSWVDPAWSSHFWSTGSWTPGDWGSHFWSTDSWANACWC